LIPRVVGWRRPRLKGERTDPLAAAEAGASAVRFRRGAFHGVFSRGGAVSFGHADPDIEIGRSTRPSMFPVSLVFASMLGGAQVSIDLRKIVAIVAIPEGTPPFSGMVPLRSHRTEVKLPRRGCCR
jgi:hypothetical protein